MLKLHLEILTKRCKKFQLFCTRIKITTPTTYLEFSTVVRQILRCYLTLFDKIVDSRFFFFLQLKREKKMKEFRQIRLTSVDKNEK